MEHGSGNEMEIIWKTLHTTIIMMHDRSLVMLGDFMFVLVPEAKQEWMGLLKHCRLQQSAFSVFGVSSEPSDAPLSKPHSCGLPSPFQTQH